MADDGAILALLARIENLERRGERSLTQEVVLSKNGQQSFFPGTISLPGLIPYGDVNTGLASPADDTMAVVGGGVAFHVSGAGGGVPRSYLIDPAFTGSLLQLLRGGTSTPVIPDGVTPGFYALGYHEGQDDSLAPDGVTPAVTVPITSSMLQGEVHVRAGKGDMHIGVTGSAVIDASGGWTGPANGDHASGVIGVLGQGQTSRTGGRAWGGNFIAVNTVNTALDLTGVEVGVDNRAAAANVVGHKVVLLATHTTKGTAQNYGYQVAHKLAAPTDAKLFDVGFALGGAGFDAIPIRSDGALIKAFAATTQTVAYGVDLRQATCSTAAFSSTGFDVLSGGTVLVANNTGFKALTTGGAARTLAVLDSSNDAEFGDSDLSTVRVVVGGGTEARFSGSGSQFGSPTGGYKGAGTVNAKGLYDDGTLVADAFWDLYHDGRIRPEDEERFAGLRLMPIAEVEAFTRRHRHLPDLPGREEWAVEGRSLGELASRFWLAIERVQGHIFELDRRLKVLEGMRG